MAWHEKRWADAILRLAGAIALAVAFLITRRLFGTADRKGKVTPLCYLLALVGVASACAGAALAVLGRHLFDQVELPSRWTVHDAPRKRRRGRD